MDPSQKSSAANVHCRHCGEVHPNAFSHCPNTGRSLTSGRALVGRVIAERYRILALIAEGGMGAVYVAEHLLVGRKVAVKRLHPELAGDEKAIARLQREARAAGATGHEHVVEIHDLGFADDGAPFLVMEYLRGKSLAQLLHEEERLEPERACRIVGQVLAALDAVHARGIVHRDLKPDNIILTRRRGDPEFVKVVDFGISKVRPEEGETPMNLTRTGAMLGTPFYMSPEQARGVKNLDQRLDLFAAGVILYEALAGKLPFAGDNYHQLLQAILSGRHVPIDERCPSLDADLAATVEKAIATSPDDRFQTAREMLAALVPHGAEEAGPAQEGTEPPPPLRRLSQVTALRTTARASVAFTPAPSSPEPPPTEPSRQSSAVTPQPKGFAAQPQRFAAEPTLFVAQSESWAAKSGVRESSPPYRASATPAARASATPAARPSATPVGRPSATPVSRPSATPAGRPSATPAARPSAEIRSDEVVRSGFTTTRLDESHDRTSVKGSLILRALEALRDLAHRGDESVLQGLGDARASRVKSIRLPMTWLSLVDFVELLREADRVHGSGDGSIARRIGEFTASQELSTTHRLFMRTATPAMAVERMPRLFRAYHSNGDLDLEPGPEGYRLRLAAVEPDTLVHAHFLGGFVERLVEMAGGAEARARVRTSRERGEDATVLEVVWK